MFAVILKKVRQASLGPHAAALGQMAVPVLRCYANNIGLVGLGVLASFAKSPGGGIKSVGEGSCFVFSLSMYCIYGLSFAPVS